MTVSALSIALGYIKRGWSPVPVPYRQKGPVIKDWQKLRLTRQTARRYFNGDPLNIGVILGPPSADLCDVDLDCPEAIAAAAASTAADRTFRPAFHARRALALSREVSGRHQGGAAV